MRKYVKEFKENISLIITRIRVLWYYLGQRFSFICTFLMSLFSPKIQFYLYQLSYFTIFNNTGQFHDIRTTPIYMEDYTLLTSTCVLQ